MAEKNKVSEELLSLVKLVSFFKQLRHKDTIEKTGFFFVNELFNISNYKQCVFWTYQDRKIKFESASGQIDISDQSPYIQSLKKLIEAVIVQKFPDENTSVDRNVDENGYAEFYDVSSKHSKLLSKAGMSTNSACLLLFSDEELIGGVWFDRATPLGKMEKAILEDAGDALAVKMHFLNYKKKSFLSSVLKVSKSAKIIGCLLILFCLWPVRFSITANAEIVAENADSISAPYNALISEVLVKPNQAVSKGDVLFTLDKTQLESEYALVVQELSTARERLAKTERESFIDSEKKYEINALRGLVEEKTLSVDYAKKRLNQSDVVSPKGGIILFSDTNDLIGQPVSVGDQVMIVADPDNIELLARIPADSMIDLNHDVPVKFFLNTSPLKSHKGKTKNVSYQAVKTPDGLLAYNARVEIENKDVIERIGLMGTAKLYGGRTVMILNILRRPFIGLRNLLAF